MQRGCFAYFSTNLAAVGSNGIEDLESVFCLVVKIHCSPSIPLLICDLFNFLTSAYAKPVKQQNIKTSRTWVKRSVANFLSAIRCNSSSERKTRSTVFILHL